MKTVLKKLKLFFLFFGFDPRIFIYNIIGFGWFLKDYFSLKKEMKNQNEFKFGKMYPVLKDKFSKSGDLTGHYFFQDLFVANRIFNNLPKKHVDIGSRVDGFVAHIATFREIEVFDIRPLTHNILNVKFIQADFTKLTPELMNYTDSISCLHAIEHFGLGRYGDKIDLFGHLKGLDAIYFTLKQSGKFYFSTPIGPQRIEFNAHRVFSLEYLLNLFKDKYVIDNFSYINDKNELKTNVILSKEDIDLNFDCNFGCGIFVMTKK